MDTIDGKKISVITNYVTEVFSENDWFTFGQITGRLDVVGNHPRLLRSLSFGDDDYYCCAAKIVDSILAADIDLIPVIIDHFDIDLWYQQKHPDKYQRVFLQSAISSADFWKEGYLKVFISHLSSNRSRVSALKDSLADWGISAFIAHEDIEASREWRDEVEAGLETMEVLIAVVEPKFKDSDWCAQEVGFALGRKIDVIPLRAGQDPFGIFGKYQGVQIKNKFPNEVAKEVAKLLLKKPKHRSKLLQGTGRAFSNAPSKKKIELIKLLDTWSVVTDAELKLLLERVSLSNAEKSPLKTLITQVGAFAPIDFKVSMDDEWDDDVPF